MLCSYRCCALVALLTCLSPLAAAATYDFSGTAGGPNFPACSGTWSSNGSTYTCSGSVALAAGDAVLPSSPLTIVAQGGAALAGGNVLGSASAAVTLQTVWDATVTLSGGNTVIFGNLTTDSGAVSIGGSGNVIYGSLTATNWGAIVAANTVVYGNVDVYASVTLTNVTIKGAISTRDQAFMTGGSVAGDLAATNGVTTDGTVIGGDVRLTTSGSISLTGGSVAGMVHSDCCTVGTTNTNIGNGVSSSSNSVTINGGTISGVVTSGGGSGVKITNAIVTSSATVTVSANNVGIDIGSSTIYGSVSGNNSVRLHDGTTVWGDATAGNWPGALDIDGTSQVSGNCSPHHARCGVVQMDHILLSHSGSGVTCMGSPVKVTACNSSDVAGSCVPSAKAISGKIVAKNGVSVVGTFDFAIPAGAGSTSVPVLVGSAQTVTLETSDLSLATAKPTSCWNTGSGTDSCEHVFVDAGFIVSATKNGGATGIDAQSAGAGSATYFLQAVKTNPVTKACEAALANTTTSVNFGYECIDPSTCFGTDLMTLNGSTSTVIPRSNRGGSSAAGVTMSFDTDGNAPFTLNYADAGLVTLRANKTVGATILNGAWSFVTKPYGFKVASATCKAVTPNASNGANQNSPSPSDSKFCPAGGSFDVSISAIEKGGNITPNYGREETAKTVNVTWNVGLPAGGNAGTLPTGAFGFSGDFTGSFEAAKLSWSEVGILRATIGVSGDDYLGAGNVRSDGYVGRFYPHHFETLASGQDNCATFAYAGRPGAPGQPFKLIVFAKNLSRGTTENYDFAGGFAMLDVDLSLDAGSAVGSLFRDATPGAGKVTKDKFSKGFATVFPGDDTGRISFAQGSFPTRPADIRVRAQSDETKDATVTDAKGDVVAHPDGPLPIRSGRLHLSNAFGSEKRPLAMPLQAQYWSGLSWVVSSDDGCTALPAGAFALVGPVAAKTKVNNASPIMLVKGTTQLVLQEPLKVGTADISVNLGSGSKEQSCLNPNSATLDKAAVPWLRTNGPCAAATYDRDPSARATFGIYTPENRRVIHIREMY
ncbi:MAG TPA: DUF6701 domain-containing protein [Rhodocyclaceae bacterium]